MDATADGPTSFEAACAAIGDYRGLEAGKPINDAEGEVTRLIDTFQIAAEESTRMHGELQALDISPRAKGYQGMWKRVPIGPCSFCLFFPSYPVVLIISVYL